MAKRKKPFKRSYNRETDAGDIAKKIMQGISHVYKAGGPGLVLMAIGSVVLIFLLLLRSMLDTATFVIAILISLLLLGIGTWILLKEKKIIN